MERSFYEQAWEALDLALKAYGPERAMLLDEALRLHRRAVAEERRTFREESEPED